MKKEMITFWLKAGALRNRQRDVSKIISVIDSAEINAQVAKTITLNDTTATLIFRDIYESVRQLGDAQWWLLGFEPTNHEVSMDVLKEFDITEKIKLNSLERFKKTRHDINYRGFRTSVSQTIEIIYFWNTCGQEIMRILRKDIRT